MKFCQDHQYLKSRSTRSSSASRPSSCSRSSASATAARATLQGKELMYFYLDLYIGDQPPRGSEQQHQHHA